jgi:hypothetical protein
MIASRSRLRPTSWFPAVGKRARVVAAGLTDEDVDRLINEARTEAQPLLE